MLLFALQIIELVWSLKSLIESRAPPPEVPQSTNREVIGESRNLEERVNLLYIMQPQLRADVNGYAGISWMGS